MHKTRPHRIAVVGCGHVGLITAAGFARLGHAVTGIDCDTPRIESLHRLELPFDEPGLFPLVRDETAGGRLAFTTSFAEGLAGAEAIFLCVSTPSTVTGAPDLRHVRAAVADIARALPRSGRQPVIVNKSTSPIGTGETIEAILRRAFHANRATPTIVSNPEFLREGHGVEDFFHPSRIVVGSDDPAAARFVAGLYRGVPGSVLVTTLRAAEMIKYVSNAFLATRVSFANEAARLCEAIGVDADVVLTGAGMDPRIGTDFFSPGIGFGGSCLPKDVAALVHMGETFGSPTRLISAVQEVNTHQRKHVVNALRRALGGLDERIVAIWGLTFKGGTDDTRDSPALDIVSLLANDGAIVRCYDPAHPPGGSPLQGLQLCYSPVEACVDADALAVLTDWPHFRDVNLHAVREVMARPVIFDGRNVLDRDEAERLGFAYSGIGRPPRRPLPLPVDRLEVPA
jgi:UDPglucose 6-dehydrogenase